MQRVTFDLHAFYYLGHNTCRVFLAGGEVLKVFLAWMSKCFDISIYDNNLENKCITFSRGNTQSAVQL